MRTWPQAVTSFTIFHHKVYCAQPELFQHTFKHTPKQQNLSHNTKGYTKKIPQWREGTYVQHNTLIKYFTNILKSTEHHTIQQPTQPTHGIQNPTIHTQTMTRLHCSKTWTPSKSQTPQSSTTILSIPRYLPVVCSHRTQCGSKKWRQN